MPRRTRSKPRWRVAFLRALGRTGNVRLACAMTPIDHALVYRLRKSDPAFASQWEAAKARAGKRLWADEVHHPRRAPRIGARELIVVGGRGFVPPRMQPARRFSWTRAKEALFLDALASTCNVQAAARAANVSQSAAYQHRQHWPGFAAEWQAALENGLAALEMRLIEGANRSLSEPRMFIPAEVPIFSAAEAISLLGQHRRQQSGTVRRHWTPKLPSIEEVRADILRKLAAMDRHGDGARTSEP